MKNSLLLITIVILFSSCASRLFQETTYEQKPYNGSISSIQNGQDIQKYLSANVDKKTLKKWNSALSDDTIIIEKFDQNGRKIETFIGR